MVNYIFVHAGIVMQTLIGHLQLHIIQLYNIYIYNVTGNRYKFVQIVCTTTLTATNIPMFGHVQLLYNILYKSLMCYRGWYLELI